MQECLLFISCLGQESDRRFFLKEDGQEILMMAISSIEDVVKSLKDGTTEFQILHLLCDVQKRFLVLCEHMGKKEANKSSLADVVRQRCIELAAFEEERGKVSTLLRMCSNIKQGN